MIIEETRKLIFLRLYRQVRKMSHNKLPFHLRILTDDSVKATFRIEYDRAFDPNFKSQLDEIKANPHYASSFA